MVIKLLLSIKLI